MSTRTLSASLSLVLLATLLAACGRKAADAPAPKATTPAAAATTALAAPTAAPAPARSAGEAPAGGTTFRVIGVTLGSEVDAGQRISIAATQFPQSTATVYASVESTGVTPDVALGARWNYLEGSGRLVSTVTQHLASDGPARTTFSLHNPDLWPEGKYSIEISVDGKPVKTQAFTIGK